MSGRGAADTFRLHLITDRKRCRGDLLAVVRRGLAGGVDWVQVREKTQPASETYTLARQVQQECRRVGGGLIINDRVDIALALGADGVHLAKKSLPVEIARPLAGTDILLGCSVHSLDEAVRASRAGADYLTFGNVYATASHPGAPAKGAAMLRAIVEEVEVPVLAIGGITPENVDEVLATGCAGIAVIGAILGTADPAAAAAELRVALDRETTRPRHVFPAIRQRTLSGNRRPEHGMPHPKALRAGRPPAPEEAG